MKKIFLYIIFAIALLLNSNAQELNCNVVVNADKLPTLNKRIVSSMQKDISEFMNSHRWTDLQYQQNEKIECSLIIILNQAESDKLYKAEIQVQARRPVFNSTYYTPLFSFRDENFSFEYVEMTPLEYNDGIFMSNLTSVLAYYAYIIVGYDSDSFSKLGGTASFRKAEAIVNLAQGQSEKGWKAFEDPRNRYSLVTSLLDESMRPFREFYYEYHRLDLDAMAENTAKAVSRITLAMQVLRDVNRARPSNVVLTSFLDTKRDEIINIFSKASPKDKTDAYKLLMDIDPSQSTKYDAILK